MMNQIVITREMISTLITQCSNVEPPKNIFKRKKSDLTVMLESAYSPDLQKLLNVINLLDPDTSRGNGSIDVDNPGEANWLGLVWSMANLGDGAKEIARSWSRQSKRYTEDGFESAWRSYDPRRENAITIGSLFKLAENISTPNENAVISGDVNDSETRVPNRFVFQSTEEILRLPPIEWCIKGLLPKSGLASIYGPSGSGKSFFAMGLLASIVLGKNFFGRKTRLSPVVYVVLEGAAGVQRRIQAYERYHKVSLPSNLKIVTQNFSLLNDDYEQFSSELIEAGLSNGVVVIDTLSQASPGGDENSSTDMGTLIAAAQNIERKTGSLVILIHHTGKDASRGARGHSSLFAALDAGIELKRLKTGREWSISKSKDSVDGGSHPFKLETIPLGIDEDGDEITSCVAIPDLFRPNEIKAPSGKHQKVILQYLRDHLGDSEAKDFQELIEFCRPAMGAHLSNPKQRIKESLEALINQGQIIESDGLFQLKK
jgi:hypothetical protein